MTRDREKYLFDMLDSCRFLIEFTNGERMARFTSDRPFRAAIERELQIIGEAMLQLHTMDPAFAAQIPEHGRIIGFRHVLVHGYHSINPDVVWNVITRGLPELRTALEKLLPDA